MIYRLCYNDFELQKIFDIKDDDRKFYVLECIIFMINVLKYWKMFLPENESILTENTHFHPLTSKLTRMMQLLIIVIMNCWKSVNNIAWTIKLIVSLPVDRIQIVLQIATESMPDVLLIVLAMRTVRAAVTVVQILFAKVSFHTLGHKYWLITNP